MSTSPAPTEIVTASALRSERRHKMRKYLVLYVFCVVPFVSLFIFHYLPIYGIVLAFKDLRFHLGILGSPWNNFQHFKDIFTDPFFGRVLRNTIIISVLKLGFAFPAPIILAIMISEIGNSPLKKTIQSITYLPHFMSWVVLAAIIIELLSPQRGVPGYVAALFRLDEVPNIMTTRSLFRPLVVVSHIWQTVGWGSIIYLAAISTIDPELYDVAAVDGANRLRQAISITVPSLVPVMVVLFIFQVGRMLNAGFDQIFNLYNSTVLEVADIIDTYVYRVGLIQLDYSFSTAVGLFKNVIGFVLVIAANSVVRRFSEYALW